LGATRRSRSYKASERSEKFEPKGAKKTSLPNKRVYKLLTGVKGPFKLYGIGKFAVPESKELNIWRIMWFLS